MFYWGRALMKTVTKKSVAKRSVARECAYIALAVSLITVCAWISIPVGPVPVTLQTLAVCLIGALFGLKRSLPAILVYIFMGLIGIPVFAGFKAGAAALFGPTGGYIFGFLFAALFPALAKLLPVRRSASRCMLFYAASVVGLAVCYLFGTVWFVLMYRCTVGYALALCVLPFILPDLAKLLVSALLAVRLERYLSPV